MTRLEQERTSLSECERLVAECESRLAAAERRQSEAVHRVSRAVERTSPLRAVLSAVGLPGDASVENVSTGLERQQSDLDTAEGELSQARSDVAARERALHEARDHRRATGDELRTLSAEERELTPQLNEATSEVRSALGAVPEDDGDLTRELKRIRVEERLCAERLQDISRQSDRIRADLDGARETLTACEDDIRNGERKVQEWSSRTAKLESDLRVLGRAEAAATRRTQEQELAQVERLVRDGQSVRKALDVQAARGMLAAVDARLSALAQQRQQLERGSETLSQWHGVLAQVTGILQQEKARVVRQGLEPIGDFMKRVHRRLVRHPLFDEVEWTIGENAIHFWASARSGIVEGRRLVQAYTNQAQQNIIALSVFLAVALCRGGRLRTLVLDDPVQALDEVNIYGLLDLLRQVSEQAQVILTTGRNDLFHLARAKFACLNDADQRRFRAYRLKWGGPHVGTLVEEVT